METAGKSVCRILTLNKLLTNFALLTIRCPLPGIRTVHRTYYKSAYRNLQRTKKSYEYLIRQSAGCRNTQYSLDDCRRPTTGTDQRELQTYKRNYIYSIKYEKQNRKRSRFESQTIHQKSGIYRRRNCTAGKHTWLSSCTPEKLKEIRNEKARIALIGTGSRGQYHIHNLKEIPHARIVAVCDNYAPNLQQAVELCPGAKAYTDYRKLLELADIDGVIISTPLNWHAPIVLDALAARQTRIL